MGSLDHLFENNRAWSDRLRAEQPDFFPALSRQQAPEYLWIGCADSRVPANQIVNLLPGEMFVHRNVANVVAHSDLNCLSVMQFAVDVLKVRHIIVCGHYGCGGVQAALEDRRLGLIDNWLRHIQAVRDRHADALAKIPDARRADRLCELNVLAQALNAARTTIVQDAWARKQPLWLHAWVYGLGDGRLRDLGFTVTADTDLAAAHAAAVAGRRTP